MFDNENNKSEIEKMPQEILVHFFSFFNKRELAKAGEVCRSFYALSRDEQLQKNAIYPKLDYTQLLPKKTQQIFTNEMLTCIAVLSENELVSSSFNKTVRIWNFKTGQCTKLFIGHEDWVRGVAKLSDN